MATSARRTSSAFGRTPDYRSANEAIDSVLANAAFGQKKTNLRKQFKRAEKNMDFSSKEAKAATDRAARFGLNVQRTGAGVQAQNEKYSAYQKQLQQRIDKFNSYTKQNTITVTDPETGKKKQVLNLTGAALQQYKNRQQSLQMEQRKAKAQGKALQSDAAAYNASLAEARRLQARAEKRATRYQALHKAYMRSYKRYKSFSNYVPYRPA